MIVTKSRLVQERESLAFGNTWDSRVVRERSGGDSEVPSSGRGERFYHGQKQVRKMARM